MKIRSRLIRVVLTALLVSGAQAQNVTFRSETTLMEVEVRVTDRRNNPIRDLTADDFKLYENGELQDIRAFELVRPLTAEEVRETQPAAAPAAPSAEQSFASGDATLDQMRRSKFIYIAARGRREDRSIIANAIKEFIEEQLQPGVLISLEGTPFTSSKSQLLKDLDGVYEKNWSGQGGMVDRLSEGLADDIEYSESFEEALSALNDNFTEDDESAVDLDSFYSGLMLYRYIDLVRALSIYPGKKIVVLFSSGMGLDEANLDLVNTFAAEAMKARVTFYTTDVRRLTAINTGFDAEATPSFSSLTNPVGNGFQRGRDRFQDTQDGLVTLAEETGGRAILNSNDLGLVFDEVMEDTNEYYVLGYYPKESSGRGRFRQIKVEVDRPGTKIDYRKGYYEEQSFDRMSKAEKQLQLHQALQFDTPFTDLPLTASFELFRSAEGMPALAYSVGIHPRDLPTGATKKGLDVAFTVAARALPSLGQGDGAMDERRLDMRLEADSFAKLQTDPHARIHYSSEMVLPPGEYSWKVVIRDELTGKLGSYKTKLNVPDLNENLASSTLLVTGRIQQLQPSKKKPVGPPPSLDIGPMRFIPDSARVYLRGDTVYLLYDVYNAPAEQLASPPGARLALYLNREKVEQLPISGYQAVPVPANGQLRYMAALDTAKLDAGEYFLVAMLPPQGNGAAPVIYRKFTVVDAPTAQ